MASNTPAVQASTGVNDPSSAWASGLLSTLESLGQAAGTGYQTYQTVTGSKKPATNTAGGNPGTTSQQVLATAPSSPTSGWKSYLPWIIGGGVVLALLGFLVLRRK